MKKTNNIRIFAHIRIKIESFNNIQIEIIIIMKLKQNPMIYDNISTKAYTYFIENSNRNRDDCHPKRKYFHCC